MLSIPTISRSFLKRNLLDNRIKEVLYGNAKKNPALRQWHPAFYAGAQIELQEDADNLIFENEHQLGTKPKGIDVLIIKKQVNRPVKKNIGKLFRKHNIIEYKSPTDYLNIDDFYKVYGYACFYKSDVSRVNSIPIEELTISFVSHGYPRKLMKHLKKKRGFRIQKMDAGIYYILGDFIPIQIIVTRYLSPEKNLWLSSLTDHLKDKEVARKLLEDFGNHKQEILYRSVMNIIMQANKTQFQEVKDMLCEALEELMKDELEANRSRGLSEGRMKGLQEGQQQATDRLNALTLKLAELGRTDDIIKAASDTSYQKKLLEELGIS